MSTTLGIISDIHSDLHALHFALDILQGQGAEQIICAGDLIEKGPVLGNDVVTLIRKRGVQCVMGNHDSYFSSGVWEFLNSDERLDTENIEFLKKLPRCIEATIEDKQVFMAHGTPMSFGEYLFPYSSPKLFKRSVETADSDVIILGHTHEPMQVRYRGTWILNPGSVCGEYSHGSRTCATLTLPECTFHVFNVRNGKRVQPARVSDED